MNKKKICCACLFSAVAVMIIAWVTEKNRTKKYTQKKLKKHPKQIMDEDAFWNSGQVSFTQFEEIYGSYYFNMEKEGCQSGVWTIYFPHSSPQIEVKIPSRLICDEMWAFSNSYSNDHLKGIKEDIDFDELLKKGVAMSLFANKDNLFIQRNKDGYVLGVRDNKFENFKKEQQEKNKRIPRKRYSLYLDGYVPEPPI